jgi:hypothetical protein
VCVGGRGGRLSVGEEGSVCVGGGGRGRGTIVFWGRGEFVGGGG